MRHQSRRKFSDEEKAAILRQHLVDKKAVSDVCDAHGILSLPQTRPLDSKQTPIPNRRPDHHGTGERGLQA